MRNVVAVFRRELGNAFGQPLAYAVLTLFTGLVALFSLVLDDVLAGPQAVMSVPFFWAATCLVLLVPAVTMRLLAEERRTGSLELLGSLPLTPLELVLGKWLAATALVACALALTLGYPIALSLLGPLDWGPVVGGYVGLLLLGASLAAVGTATSAWTDAQVLAFLAAFALCALPWVMGFFLAVVPGPLAPFAQYLTFEYHFSNLARGVLDTRSLVFFGSVAVAALRLAVLALEQRRLG